MWRGGEGRVLYRRPYQNRNYGRRLVFRHPRILHHLENQRTPKRKRTCVWNIVTKHLSEKVLSPVQGCHGPSCYRAASFWSALSLRSRRHMSMAYQDIKIRPNLPRDVSINSLLKMTYFLYWIHADITQMIRNLDWMITLSIRLHLEVNTLILSHSWLTEYRLDIITIMMDNVRGIIIRQTRDMEL